MSAVDYQSLYQRNTEELQKLRDELKEYQETSKSYEDAMEQEMTELEKKNKLLTAENEKLKTCSIEIKEKYEATIKRLEKQVDKFKNDKYDIEDSMKSLESKIIFLENENAQLESQQRNSENLIKDLEDKIDNTLEELAIVQTELEENRNKAQENIERLKQHLKDTESELQTLQIKSARRLEEYSHTISDFNHRENNNCNIINKDLLISNSPAPVLHNKDWGSGSSCKNFLQVSCSDVAITSGGAGDRDSYNLEIDKENIQEFSNTRFTSARNRPSFRLDLQKVEPHIDFKANSERIRETKQRDLEEKVRSFNTNINCFKLNNLGFSKSLFLVNGLIHDLDEKINKIRLNKIKKII